MSILRRAAERRSLSVSDVFGRGYDLAPSVSSGERVSYQTVTGLDAVAACVGLYSDIVEMLPVDVFRDRAGTADPLVRAPDLVDDPSDLVDADVWRAQMLVSWLLWGNAYGIVTSRDRLELPRTIEWLDPATVHVAEYSQLRRPSFTVEGTVVPPDEFVHVPGRYVRPGTTIGIAPLERFRETFGLALAARRYGAQWFGDGGHPSAILSSKKPVGPEQAATMKARFMAAVRGKREPAVLGSDTTYTPIQTPAGESQFLETQDHSTVAVARVFGLPPEMVAAAVSGSSVTYANREQRAIDFLTFAVDPWLVRMERFWTRRLPRPQYAKFNRGALLRTDLLTRYRAHDTAIRAGWRSVNEVRQLEDEPPIDGGDETLWPPYATSLQPVLPGRTDDDDS